MGGLAIRLGKSLLAPMRFTIQQEALPGPASICQAVPAELGEAIDDVATICVATGA